MVAPGGHHEAGSGAVRPITLLAAQVSGAADTQPTEVALLAGRLSLDRIVNPPSDDGRLGSAITDRAELGRRLHRFAAATRRVLLSLHAGPPPDQELLASSAGEDDRLMERGVRLRLVMPLSYLDVPYIPPYVRDIERRGARVKFAEGVPHRLIVSDGVRAIVPMDNTDLSRGAFVTTSRQLVSGLQALADALYRKGLPLEAVESGSPVDRPSEFELRLLTMLSTGVADAVAARRLAVSERTFRRHVTSLLKRLGAENRFQAGVRAVERGWL